MLHEIPVSDDDDECAFCLHYASLSLSSLDLKKSRYVLKSLSLCNKVLSYLISLSLSLSLSIYIYILFMSVSFFLSLLLYLFLFIFFFFFFFFFPLSLSLSHTRAPPPPPHTHTHTHSLTHSFLSLCKSISQTNKVRKPLATVKAEHIKEWTV